MDPSSISKWAEFGLAGLVIFALFVALFFIVKWLISHIDKQAEAHREERKEWRDQTTAVSDKINASVDQLNDSIKELARNK